MLNASPSNNHQPGIGKSVANAPKHFDLCWKTVFRFQQTHGNQDWMVIVGSGSLEQYLRERIQAQPYAEHILLCGDVSHSATMASISRADLMLRTTLYDGDAVSVREALHVGTPVLATDNGMRPAGVHLIPKSDMEALEITINQTLGTTRASGRIQSATDESNLQAVLKMYEELASMARHD